MDSGESLADRDRVADLLKKYVETPSVNPAIDNGAGESAVARLLESDLRTLGIDPVRQRVSEGRENILGLVQSPHDSRTLMLEAHMDTVGPTKTDPRCLADDEGIIHGRGACDAKGSLVAMLEAIRILRDDPGPYPNILMAGVVDEEFAGLGAQKLMSDCSSIDWALVGEPTDLNSATAHKGALRFEITCQGVAAHSSQPNEGANAIYGMSRLISLIEGEYAGSLERRPHPLVGPPTVNVSTIRGGRENNVVPDECTIVVDRRTVPDEEATDVILEFEALLAAIYSDNITFRLGTPFLAMAPVATDVNHPLVVSLSAARASILGTVKPAAMGMPFGTDASYYSAAGIPSVIFGPGSIGDAHTDFEKVSIEDVALAAEIIAETARRLGTDDSKGDASR